MKDDAIDRVTVERWRDLGQETLSIEWKGPLEWKPKDAAALKIIRAMMAMANRRGGGRVVIGVSEKLGSDNVKRPELDGLTPTQAGSLSYDNIAAVARVTADPPIIFSRHAVDMGEAGAVVVLSVSEFDDEPVICLASRHSSDGDEILKGGTIYYRNHGSISSKAIASAADMRELLRLATEKKLQKYHRIHQEVQQASASDDSFAAQSEDF